MNKILVEVSVGELLDKISILEIKQEKIKDAQKLKFILNEHSILKKQLRSSLERKFNINKIIVAYEPVWSIGSNRIPKVSELINTIKFIKNEYKKILKINKVPKILYGGSVNPKNIRLFSSISEIDGFLIGGASQSSKKFIDIIRNYYK